MDKIMYKYKILSECYSNPDFSSKLYLNMINEYPNIDLTYEQFQDYMDESYNIFLEENLRYLNENGFTNFFKKVGDTAANTAKGIKNKFSKKNKEPKEKLPKTRKSIKQTAANASDITNDIKTEVHDAKGLGSNIERIGNNVTRATAKANNAMSHVDSISGKIDNTMDNVHSVAGKVDRSMDDVNSITNGLKGTVKKVGDDASYLTGQIRNDYDNAKRKAKKIGKGVKIGGAIAGGALVAGGTLKAIQHAKDKKKYQAWKKKKYKERQYITFKQWKDLGKPLKEDAFLMGYYDALEDILNG